MALLRSRLVRRIGLAGGVLLAAHSVGGCYAQQRVDTSMGLPTNAEVVLDITDRGRVALDGRIGQSPKRVSGRVQSFTDSTVTLSMKEVEGLSGERQPWQGEIVTLPRDAVGGVETRRISRARTLTFAALLVAGLVALVVGISIASDGAGGGDTDRGPGGGDGSSS
jgi:hypothetical protein